MLQLLLLFHVLHAYGKSGRNERSSHTFQTKINESNHTASSKPTLVFVCLEWDWTYDSGLDGTQRTAYDWNVKLSLGGVNEQIFSIDPGRILFNIADTRHVKLIMKFLLEEPHIDFIELNKRFYYPNGRKAPLLTSAQRMNKEIEAGFRPAPPQRSREL